MPPKTAAERDQDRRARLKAEGKTARIVWVFPEVVDSLKDWVKRANEKAAKERKSSNTSKGFGHIEDKQ